MRKNVGGGSDGKERERVDLGTVKTLLREGSITLLKEGVGRVDFHVATSCGSPRLPFIYERDSAVGDRLCDPSVLITSPESPDDVLQHPRCRSGRPRLSCERGRESIEANAEGHQAGAVRQSDSNTRAKISSPHKPHRPLNRAKPTGRPLRQVENNRAQGCCSSLRKSPSRARDLRRFRYLSRWRRCKGRNSTVK